MGLLRIREWMRSSLLFLPGAIAAGLLALSILVLQADGVFDRGWVPSLFRGNSTTARSVLATIATATVTLTALVFSITMLVLQLASSQYSPRVLRTFLADRNSKITLGIFVGTFAYSLSVLRGLEPSDSEETPGIAMSIGLVLALATIVAFVQYINHIAQRVRVSNIVSTIADETLHAVDQRYGHDDDREPFSYADVAVADRVVMAQSRGVLIAIDVDELVELARAHELRIGVAAVPGEFVPRGAPILAVTGDGGADDRTLLRAISLAPDRTMAQDPAFGIRQLVDIASRALSPSLNDPTTAVEALNQIHAVLRDLATRELGDRSYRDKGGSVRLVVPDRDWHDYLGLALDEITVYGREHPQVVRRLRAVLEDLATVTEGDRRACVLSKMQHPV